MRNSLNNLYGQYWLMFTGVAFFSADDEILTNCGLLFFQWVLEVRKINRILFLFAAMCMSLASTGWSPDVNSPTLNRPKYVVLINA